MAYANSEPRDALRAIVEASLAHLLRLIQPEGRFIYAHPAGAPDQPLDVVEAVTRNSGSRYRSGIEKTTQNQSFFSFAQICRTSARGIHRRLVKRRPRTKTAMQNTITVRQSAEGSGTDAPLNELNFAPLAAPFAD